MGSETSGKADAVSDTEGPYEVRPAEDGDGYAVGYEIDSEFHESCVEETKKEAEEVCEFYNEINADLDADDALPEPEGD